MDDKAKKISLELDVISDNLETALAEAAGSRVSFGLFVWTGDHATCVTNKEDDELAEVVTNVLNKLHKGCFRPFKNSSSMH